MRRALILLMAPLALASCSKAVVDNQPGNASVSAPDVAFTYAYTFRLPSGRIAATQEAHATACERLGPARCRIAGMTFNVDSSGDVSATLAVKLDATIARRFGREGVGAVEQAGGMLAGAEIAGTDTVPVVEAAEGQRAQNTTETARIDRELARADLRSADRTRLLEERDAKVQAGREAAASAAAARASAATTPMEFSYRAGAGVGLAASLADAGHTAWTSLVTTLSVALTIIAALGPPAVLLGLLFLLWRFGQRRWARRFG